VEAPICRQVTIRPLQGREMTVVHAISSRSFDVPYSYETLATYRHRARGGFLVAEVDGAIAGFLIATTPFLAFAGNRIGEIAVLAVDEPYRRAGIGRQLLIEGLALLSSRRMKFARLHVEVGNPGAISLYEQFGFENECIIRGYYRNGADAYRMVATL